MLPLLDWNPGRPEPIDVDSRQLVFRIELIAILRWLHEHPHRDAAPVLLDQRIGDARKGEPVDHQVDGLRLRIDFLEHSVGQLGALRPDHPRNIGGIGRRHLTALRDTHRRRPRLTRLGAVCGRPVEEFLGVGPHDVELRQEPKEQLGIIGKERRLVFEVGGGPRCQLERRPVSGAELDDPLSDENAALPMHDLGEPGRVIPQANGNAVLREVLEVGACLWVRFEDGAAIADQANGHTGSVPVENRDDEIAVVE